MALLEALLRLNFGHQPKLSKFVYHGSGIGWIHFIVSVQPIPKVYSMENEHNEPSHRFSR